MHCIIGIASRLHPDCQVGQRKVLAGDRHLAQDAGRRGALVLEIFALDA